MSSKHSTQRNIVDELKKLLPQAQIDHRIVKDVVVITLPNGFGNLEITSLGEDDDLISLEGEDWYFQTSWIEADSPDITSLDKVLHFIERIFDGSYYLIEERMSGQEPIRLIEDDLESYEAELPNGVEFTVISGG